MLIAQNDDSELLEWLVNALQMGGTFFSSLARAALVADWENYPVLRPVLIEMRKKYGAYEPSDAVKEELKARGRHSPAVTKIVDRLMSEREADRLRTPCDSCREGIHCLGMKCSCTKKTGCEPHTPIPAHV